jgi:hypothetical protein
MIKSSFLLGSILPNFALWDQGGAQARRAEPLSGPAARRSLGAGGPAINRWVAPKKTDRQQLVVGCPNSRLNVRVSPGGSA